MMVDNKQNSGQSPTGKVIHPAHRQHISFNLRFTLILIGTVAVFGIGVHFLHAYQVDRNANTFLEKAIKAEESGNLAEAVRHLQTYNGFRKNDAEAVAKLATLLDRVSHGAQLDRVYFAYEDAIRLNPDRLDLRRRFAEIAVFARRYRDALKHIDIIVKKEGESVELSLLKVECYFGQDQPLAATQELLRTIQLDPRNIQSYVTLALMFKENFEDIPRIEDLADIEAPVAILALFPSKKQLLSETNKKQVETASMVETVDKILAEMVKFGEPKGEAYVNRARFLLDRDQLDEAEADLKIAASFDKDSPQLLLTASKVSLQKSRAAKNLNQPELSEKYLKQASTAISRGLELPTSSPEFYLTRYAVDVLNDDLLAAQKSVEQGLAASKNALSTSDLKEQRKFQILYHQFRMQQIEILLLIAYQNRDKSDNPDVNLMQQAEQKIAEMKQQFTYLPELELLEGQIHVARKEWSQAIPKLERSRNNLTRDIERRRDIDRKLGYCYRQLNNPDREVIVYRRALQDDPFWTEIRMSLADALVRINRVEDAVTTYRLLGGVPEAALKLAQLLILQELNKPLTEQNWQPIEQLIEAERTLSAERGLPASPEIATTRADLLNARGLYEQALAVLNQAEIEHPNASAILVVKVKLILSNSSLDLNKRVTDSEKVLAAATERMGDSFEIRMAHLMIARALPKESAEVKLNQLEKNLEQFSRFEQTQLYENLAEAHFALGNIEQAKSLFKKILDVETNPVLLRQKLLQLARLEGDDAAAAEQLQSIRELEGEGGPNGNVVVAQNLLAKLDLKDGENPTPEQQKILAQARELLKLAENQRSSWSVIPRHLGFVEYKLGNEDIALEHFRRAMALGDYSTEVVRYVYTTLAKRGKLDEAEQILQKTYDKNPALITEDLARLARNLAYSQENTSGADRYAQMSVKDSQNPADYIFLSNIKFANGERGEDVEKPLLDALEHFPKVPDVWLAYVRYLARTEKAEQALKELKQAATILPQEPPHLIPSTMARGYEMLGFLAEATTEYELALKVSPENTAVKVQLIEFYLRTNSFDQAEPLLTGLASLNTEIPETVRNWAERRKAQIIVSRGTYADIQSALKMLDETRQSESLLSTDDLRTRAMVYSRLQTKADKRKHLEILLNIKEREQLTPAEEVQLARLYDSLGDWTTAQATYAAILKKADKSPALMLEFAAALLKHQQLPAGRRWFEQAKVFDPLAFNFALFGARVLYLEGQHDKAIRSLQNELQRIDPKGNPERVLNDLLVNEQGLRLLDQLRATLLPEDPMAKSFRDGIMLLQDGLPKRAIETMQPTMSQSEFQNPIKAFYYRQASQLFSELKDYTTAEKLWNEARALHERSEDLIQQVALIARQNRVSEALDFCETEIWGNLAESYAAQTTVATLRAGKPTPQEIQRAESMIASAMAKNPMGGLTRHLGDLKEFNQEYDQAISLYLKAIQENRQDYTALNNMAFLTALLDENTNRALDSINAAIDLVGPAGALLDTRGVVYLKRGEYKNAIRDLERANVESTSLPTQYYLAQAYWKNGQKELGKTTFNDAVESGLKKENLHMLDRDSFDEVAKLLNSEN